MSKEWYGNSFNRKDAKLREINFHEKENTFSSRGQVRINQMIVGQIDRKVNRWKMLIYFNTCFIITFQREIKALKSQATLNFTISDQVQLTTRDRRLKRK